MSEDLRRRLRDLSPEKRALLEDMLLRRVPGRPESATIPLRDPSGPCPLSPFQERIWFLEQLNPGIPLYSRTWAARLRGPLDADALEGALNAIVARHEVLRAAVRVAQGVPTQTFHANRTVRLARIDLAPPRGEAPERVVEQVLRQEARRLFDLERDPLLRATLVRRGEADHVFALTTHHLVFDDGSLRVLLRELSLLYAGAVEGRPVPLEPASAQFGSVAVWQRQRLDTAAAAEDVAYWTARLRDAPPILDLPSDRPRPARLSHRGAVRTAGLGVTLTRRLDEASRSEGVSRFTLLLAAFATLLSRYSDREDLVLGVPVTNRDRPEFETLMGPLIDTLALRMDLSGTPPFRELLQRARHALAEAYAHRTLPFERLVDALPPDHALDHTPVFQVMLGWRDPASLMQHLQLPGVTVRPVDIDQGTAKFDLTLVMTEAGGQILCETEYSTDLFEASTIERLLAHFATLVGGAAADPGARLWALPLTTAAERRQLLVEWNATRRDYPADRTVHALFAEQARATPDAVAVVFGDRQLTYRELDGRANQLAQHLHALGVGPDVPVGLAVERSPEMVVALLGILKAGGAYVPLDPADPRERLAFLLEDTRAPLLLTQARFRDRVAAPPPPGALTVVCLDADWPAIAGRRDTPPADRATPDSLAYVTYTSGSTGRPQGVCVPHRGVVRLVRNTDYASLTAHEVFLQLAPLAFDASTFEIWAPLLNGARLAVFPPDLPTGETLARAVRRHQVTTLWLTAALFHHVVDQVASGLGPVRQLLAGGDVLSVPHVRRALREWTGIRLINGYGPTENTTFTSCHTITEADAEKPSIPIGRPIANTRVYVLDRHGQPVPVGIPGELYAGGDGLARGYLHRPVLTAARFVPDPWSGDPAARLYRTGDRARWQPDGTLEFLGRTDRQVKIRGFRIEPGEVEVQLGQHPAVRDVAVVVREGPPGEKSLVAYHVPRGEAEPRPHELRQYLRDRLPAYMIPPAFVRLPALPLTPNGKVDRAALPDPVAEPDRPAAPPSPPTPMQTLVASVWSEVLKRARVGPQDDFFDLGGHSLLATQVMARLSDALRRDLPLSLIFEAPTVAELSARLTEAPAVRPGPAAAGGPDAGS
jgi:aspartate racemase